MGFRSSTSAGNVTNPEPIAAATTAALPASPEPAPAVDAVAAEMRIPPQPAVGAPYPWAAPALPPQPQRNYFWAVLTTLLVASMVVALGGVAGTAWVLRGHAEPPSAVTWVDVRPEVGGKA